MITTAAIYRSLSIADVARSVKMAPQNFYRKLNRGHFTPLEFSKIARLLGADFVFYFNFPDGSKIGSLDRTKQGGVRVLMK